MSKQGGKGQGASGSSKDNKGNHVYVPYEEPRKWSYRESHLGVLKCYICEDYGHSDYNCPLFRKAEKEAIDYDRECHEREQRALMAKNKK